jgi:23S rRNA pseudouridine1911/1915/1917 synthase
MSATPDLDASPLHRRRQVHLPGTELAERAESRTRPSDPANPTECNVLHEDNHILVVEKPAGLLTQPDRSGAPSIEEDARAYIRRSRGKPGQAFLHVVHRLDRDVGGIVVCALTGKALSRLQAQQRAQEWQRVYRAWVSPPPPSDSGALEHWLRHGEHRAEIAAPHGPEARSCRLDFRVVRRQADQALIEVTLHTGRYHQIRAQLAAAGWPVLGDRKYGAAREWPHGGIALRHTELAFEHPVRRDPMRIESPDDRFR